MKKVTLYWFSYVVKRRQYTLSNKRYPIGTTWPIPPNRRSCLGCIRWKDMSNPKDKMKYSSYGNLRKPFCDYEWQKTNWRRLNNAQSELLGQFRLTGERAKKSQRIQEGAPLHTSERLCGVAHCPMCSDWSDIFACRKWRNLKQKQNRNNVKFVNFNKGNLFIFTSL